MGTNNHIMINSSLVKMMLDWFYKEVINIQLSFENSLSTISFGARLAKLSGFNIIFNSLNSIIEQCNITP